MKTVEFLDALKQKNGNCSDYALRKILDLSQATISDYRNGKKFFADHVALQVAHMLDLNPAFVLACIHAERAKRPQVKKAWERIATVSRRSAAALILSAGLMSPMPAGNSAHASNLFDGNIHYTKRRGRSAPACPL